MKILLVDNYDSFTHNLYHLIAEVNGEPPIVVRNDATTWADLAQRGFDSIVISPGPGRPDDPADFGVCAEVIREASVPLLGVCLGHQGIGHVAGAKVHRAPEVMHGRLTAVQHDESALFAGVPQGFEAVRYHSLCLRAPLPAGLTATAWSADGVIMGAAHRARPIWGLQFHPESICTEWGARLIRNFCDLAVKASTRTEQRPRIRRSVEPARSGWSPSQGLRLRLLVQRVDQLYDPERVFVNVYGTDRHAFWLDSSKTDDRARFSFMGACDGPLSSVITYDVRERRVIARGGLVSQGQDESIFEYLGRELKRLRCSDDDLPFDFNCGFVGYFGYELKADCGGDLAFQAAMPDAAFLFVDRLIAFDHEERCTYLVCLTDAANEAEGEHWIGGLEAQLESLPELEPVGRDPFLGDKVAEFSLSRSHERYLQDIDRVKQRLLAGESYEVCLTNKLHTDVTPDPLQLYRTLRRLNPAPFASYLRLGDASVLSSSPERFLRVARDRWVEAKPIKGTIRRGRDRAEDERLAEELRTGEKTRAENLMIADLLRNDLGVVCDIGTVYVPHLMAIESYETVHQLVSTVRGRLRDDVQPPQAIRACFPGGSMTGAPKKRTMEIIDELEGEPRGVYSGAIGYLGLNGGCDLSIAIRTIVMDGQAATIGIGGAIVIQSDPEEEYQETLLKARALLDAFSERCAPSAVVLREGDPRPIAESRSV